MTKFTLIVLAMILLGCAGVEQNEKQDLDFYSTALFHDVQITRVFPDSKTFVDCKPRRHLQAIVQDYDEQKSQPDFDLKSFVYMNFDLPARPKSQFVADTARTMEEHLTTLWDVLTKKASEPEKNSSVISLPYDYVVPGGRFSEVYYWDSYFTILGLKTQKRYDLIQSMVQNFAWLIDSIGFVPNGNRNYYLTRSQPPFFSLIVRELEEYDSLMADRYLDAMVKEYEFWMTGYGDMKNPGDVSQHLVMLESDVVLNRYWDRTDTPRPEAYVEDFQLAEQHKGDKKKLYRDIRAAAESGWDFSSRWFADGKTLQTIHTTDIIPVDLNCLLAHLEKMIAKGFALRKNKDAAYAYERRAKEREKALLELCWNEEAGLYMDYDFVAKKHTNTKSLAGAFPLFFSIAPTDKARRVANTIQTLFLKSGGVVTTQVDTDQQWDAPNGWAPLQWTTYVGLKNYDFDKLGDEVRDRWLQQNMRVYEATGKMMEKYDVEDTTLIGGGGEYPNQDGFGWTNGVALAFLAEQGTKIVEQ